MRYFLALVLWVGCLPALANHFYVESKYINTGNDFNKLCGQTCPAINYGLISSNDLWVQHTINKSVLSVFASTDANTAQDLLYKEFTKITAPSDKELTDFLRQSEKNLINEHKKLIKDKGGHYLPLIDISSRPNYLGHRGDLELFSISEFYQFDSRGTGSIYYYVFDIKQQRQLTLDDILIPNQKETLSVIIKDKFHTALKKGGVNVKEHEKKWRFFLTKNFIFTKDGIKFLYQPDEIAPYEMGMPEFIIRYADLTGIVQEKYLN
ncbi:MAG: RsiV family protein [Moraxella sp.]|nr:RsiV family protein [Moraxella sp.]